MRESYSRVGANGASPGSLGGGGLGPYAPLAGIRVLFIARTVAFSTPLAAASRKMLTNALTPSAVNAGSGSIPPGAGRQIAASFAGALQRSSRRQPPRSQANGPSHRGGNGPACSQAASGADAHSSDGNNGPVGAAAIASVPDSSCARPLPRSPTDRHPVSAHISPSAMRNGDQQLAAARDTGEFRAWVTARRIKSKMVSQTKFLLHSSSSLQAAFLKSDKVPPARMPEALALAGGKQPIAEAGFHARAAKLEAC